MVELKKELPEIFEGFAEQRKNSFLAIKEVKEKEIPVVGVFCTYLPREIPNAMGAAVVGLCSVSDEDVYKRQPSFLHSFNVSFKKSGCNKGSPPEKVTPPSALK